MVVYALEQWREILRHYLENYGNVMFDFGKKIFFSDEAHFDFGGYVNNQNSRIWGHKKPERIHWKVDAPKTSHCLVWVWVQKNYWAFFFWKWARSGHYSQWRTLSNHVERIFVLCPGFEDCIISRRAAVVWPPRICDLTPLNYYLWGAVKDKCYANKPETINALKENIREAIGEIQLCSSTE